MSIFLYLRKVIIHLKRNKFVRDFKHCEKTSGFGKDGFGKDCLILGKENMSIGANSWFGKGCEFIAYNSHFEQKLDSNLKIGDNVRITSRCRITCAGNITIENDVLIAPDCFITDHNHGMDPTILGGYSLQPIIVKDVHIKEGVWLGQRVSVMPGVTIGAHSIVGANSVVTHDVPDYAMVVGTPAKVIKIWDFGTKTWKKI